MSRSSSAIKEINRDCNLSSAFVHYYVCQSIIWSSQPDISPQVHNRVLMRDSVVSDSREGSVVRCIGSTTSTIGLPPILNRVEDNYAKRENLKGEFWPFKAYIAVATGAVLIAVGWCAFSGGSPLWFSVVGLLVVIAGVVLFVYGLSVHYSITDVYVPAVAFHASPVPPLALVVSL